MFRKQISQLALAIVFAGGSVASFAADKPQSSMQDMMRQHHGTMAQPQQGMMMACPMMSGGMMGGGMMGSMMGGPTAGSRIPQLPPGNEKLQLQMQAEIMQKVGEIIAKYASQIR